MAFRTESGSVSAEGRREAQKKGETMPGGSFPIRNKADLANAKQSVGRAKNPAAARRWIDKRAKELGEPPIGSSKETGERRGTRMGDESSTEGRLTRRATIYNHPRSGTQMRK